MDEAHCGPQLLAVPARCSIAERLAALRPGEMLTLVGNTGAEAAANLAEQPLEIHVLPLNLAGATTAEQAIGLILDDLAELAGALWPQWEAPTPLGSVVPSSWRRAALRFVIAGRRPRFRWLVRETELAGLLSALPDLALLCEIDARRPERAAPIIAALEWCRRNAAKVIATVAEQPARAPPWDRIVYDALTVERPPATQALRRVIAPAAARAASGSDSEQRMRAALENTRDLAGLFEAEITLNLGPLGPTPRVDLLWREGKIVVELDGAEHERGLTYAADRHRDYELMVAGYLVLRLTNAEVALDLGRAIEKVRRVVELRRRSK